MFGVTYWSIFIFYPSFHFVFTILSRSYLWFTIIFISPILTICWPCHIKYCGIYMVQSILLVLSRQIGVCGIWSYQILCYSILSYQFFSYGNWTCLNLFIRFSRFSLPIFFGLIRLLGLGLTYSYAWSWSYLFLFLSSYLFLLLSRCQRRTLLRILSQNTDMFIYSTLRAEPVFTLTESGTLNKIKDLTNHDLDIFCLKSWH